MTRLRYQQRSGKPPIMTHGCKVMNPTLYALWLVIFAPAKCTTAAIQPTAGS